MTPEEITDLDTLELECQIVAITCTICGVRKSTPTREVADQFAAEHAVHLLRYSMVIFSPEDWRGRTFDMEILERTQ